VHLTGLRPARAILELASDFYDPVAAADFPQTILRYRNTAAAASVGLDTLGDDGWVQHFGRFAPLPGSLTAPLALRYHGHQFRTYNPDLGDGRGFLFAQLYDERGRLLDLGTKGSGQTPWSRFGDGRLTLKGGVREVLATEMLTALGFDTSQTFSLIETGENLDRSDEPSPTRSAVMVRLSHSHIRYGTFQRLAALDQSDAMRKLVDYVLHHYFAAHGVPDIADTDAQVAVLIDHAVTNAARQAAGMMAAGFVHGVLNTDNINITGESFDYGPYRFAPRWEPGFTAAYFDHHGLYSFGRQAEALQWNVFQLAGALRLLASVETLTPPLRAFGARYDTALTAALLARLGVVSQGAERDSAVAVALMAALEASGAGLDDFWFDWRGGTLRRNPDAYAHPGFAALTTVLENYAPVDMAHTYWQDDAPCSLLIDEIEAIWAAIASGDDWAPFEAKLLAIRRMGAAMRRQDPGAP
jgi:serine/tyrosine/threonine adenylyltransferase